MIIVALGSNLSGPWGSPRQTVERALQELDVAPVRLVAASRFLVTEPFGVRSQPSFVNAVALLATHLPPQALLVRLQMLERKAGRTRSRRWGPRTLDLDIVDYHGLVVQKRGGQRQTLLLPHPGIQDREFVLKPVAELAPGWRHPITRSSASAMLADLTKNDRGREL